MKNEIFRGSATALVTPFTKTGDINYEVLKELINFQIQNQTKALIILGTTGEAATISLKEKIEIVKCAVQHVNRRVPVIIGSGSNDTKVAIQNSRIFEKLGADALLVVTPYYNKSTQNGLVSHFTAIADNVNIPIILYNVPSRTGVNISPQTVKKLSEHNNIVAIKEASGNLEQIIEIARLCGDEMTIYSGDDALILPILSVGGRGVIGVTNNIAPALVNKLCETFFENKIKISREIQCNLNPLIKALFMEVNPIPVKTALNLMNKNAGDVRLPLTPMEEENIHKLKTEMQKFNLL
ncbi:MAG: 4-hydroxy-tetrahydrodipicolinate synthase [Clostridia bacterium]|jgi:4-hydroxy-tetrahydrodipicolinate synthase|nr:4-hydroxy-tetrahydrodipicolinate synthase [Clostridia bacterium]MDD3232126.1 4-hydroxy-tetrahydrodipicolinate synthase [Clostridia bacterium]MDD4408426.1 4-hydroxy-tetrahydrodipicolinate synthase [Clostridia bacterium]